MDFLSHFDFIEKKHGWKIGFFIFLVMFLLGSFQEFEAIQLGKIKPVSETIQRYLMLLFCAALLLLYLIPFLIFVKWNCRKLRVNRSVSVFSGK